MNKQVHTFVRVLGYGFLIVGYVVVLGWLCAYVQEKTNIAWGVTTLLVGTVIGIATAAAKLSK